MPSIALVGHPPGRGWEKLSAELERRTGCTILLAAGALPRALDGGEFREGILLGAGPGVATATAYVGSVEDHRIWGLALLSPRFVDGSTDLREELGYIRVPILLVRSGDDLARDEAQACIARDETYCPVDVVTATGDGVAAAVADFIATLTITRANPVGT